MMLSFNSHTVSTPDGKVLQAPFDFDLSAGGRLGVTGPSGCGKSMMLRQLASAKRSKSRSITVTAKRLEYVPQNDFLFPWYTARQNYDAWARSDRNGALSTSHAALADGLGVSHLLDRSYGKLSGGERQRVALWILMCGDADLIALDEPFTALDIERKVICMEALAAWLKAGNRALVVVSHDFEILTYLADTILVFGHDQNSPHRCLHLGQSLPDSRQAYLERRRTGTYEGVIDALAGTS